MDFIIKFHQVSVLIPYNTAKSCHLPLCVFLGVWATKLGKMAGVSVPLITMHHAYIVTERTKGIQVSF